MKNIVGLKELRENVDRYARRVERGDSFLVVRRAKALFRLVPPDDEWETVVDFTKMRKGGMPIHELIARLS